MSDFAPLEPQQPEYKQQPLESENPESLGPAPKQGTEPYRPPKKIWRMNMETGRGEVVDYVPPEPLPERKLELGPKGHTVYERNPETGEFISISKHSLGTKYVPPKPLPQRRGELTSEGYVVHERNPETGEWKRITARREDTPKFPDKEGTLIAEDTMLGGDDPISKLAGTAATGVAAWAINGLKSAGELIQGAFESTHDHGGGKNAQHGKAENKPSKEKQIEEYEKRLEELTRTQGSKKEKVELKRRIENVKKSMAQDKKGENHSQKDKK